MRRADRTNGKNDTAGEAPAYREAIASGDTLLELVARANHLLAERIYEQVKWHGLSATEWRVLAALHTHDGIAMSELADLVLFKQPTLTKAVDRMERALLVERRTPTDDRRRTLVQLTKHGRDVAAPLLQRARRQAADIERLLGDAACHDLKSSLRALMARLGELPPAEPHPRAARRSLQANGD